MLIQRKKLGSDMNCEKIHQLVVKLQNALVNERCDENSTNVHAHTRAEKGNIRVSRTRGKEQTEEAPPGRRSVSASSGSRDRSSEDHYTQVDISDRHSVATIPMRVSFYGSKNSCSNISSVMCNIWPSPRKPKALSG